MFKKIIKGGNRKPSKSDANSTSLYGYNQAENRNLGSAPAPNVVVSHPSRGAVGAPNTQSGGAAAPMTTPPLGNMEPLPSFRDVPVVDRHNLFLQKLQICCFQFDFTDTMKSVREKEIKRQTLVELVEYIQTGSGKIAEHCHEEMIKMVGANIFRCLPPESHENTGQENAEPEEEDMYLEPSWPHLQLVYELLLRYIVSSDTDTKVAKRYIDHSFVLKLLDLFDSEDPREREYLKTILHRIYGKFMVHRPFIRKAINNIFYRFIYETERQNGIAVYHQQLSYCIVQFVEKDYKLADTVIRGLLKYWPVINCQKEVLFLGELEEVLEATRATEFQRCMVPLFRQVARCINSSHFQVAERSLFLWNNEHVVSLISQNRSVILPIIYEALERNVVGHWNQAVHGLTVSVRKMFMEMDSEMFQECQRHYEEKQAKTREVEQRRQLTWKRLADAASQG
ncbi:hypothetical protein SAY86_017157 [Trapa natans]|uniref:Serine/threonine protein phosphatase 2A regulatory subunit n=1 Tax=Trapa natans TaxID=22666 RepID=A0AAN7LK69_TRANT|nr:hypothetical protein SAY86_017157 [Trapa natans]